MFFVTVSHSRRCHSMRWESHSCIQGQTNDSAALHKPSCWPCTKTTCGTAHIQSRGTAHTHQDVRKSWLGTHSMITDTHTASDRLLNWST